MLTMHCKLSFALICLRFTVWSCSIQLSYKEQRLIINTSPSTQTVLFFYKSLLRQRWRHPTYISFKSTANFTTYPKSELTCPENELFRPYLLWVLSFPSLRCLGELRSSEEVVDIAKSLPFSSYIPINFGTIQEGTFTGLSHVFT